MPLAHQDRSLRAAPALGSHGRIGGAGDRRHQQRHQPAFHAPLLPAHRQECCYPDVRVARSAQEDPGVTEAGMRTVVTLGEIVVEIMAERRGTGFRAPLPLVGPFPSGARHRAPGARAAQPSLRRAGPPGESPRANPGEPRLARPHLPTRATASCGFPSSRSRSREMPCTCSASALHSSQPGAGRIRCPSSEPSSAAQPTSTGKPRLPRLLASKSMKTITGRTQAPAAPAPDPLPPQGWIS